MEVMTQSVFPVSSQAMHDYTSVFSLVSIILKVILESQKRLSRVGSYSNQLASIAL